MDADNQPCVLLKPFVLLKHHLGPWDFADCVGIEIAERAAFFNRLLVDAIRAKTASTNTA